MAKNLLSVSCFCSSRSGFWLFDRRHRTLAGCRCRSFLSRLQPVAGLSSCSRQLFSRNFVFTISCTVPIIFLSVFFLHPSKAAHLLVALPFLLLLAVDRSLALVLALIFFTLFGAVVNIDIFKDRQLAPPFFVS